MTCVQHGIKQRGRLADGDMTTSPHDELSCLHTPISELCNGILNTCQMPSHFYIILPMLIKAKHTFIKTVYNTLSYGRPYMQAKHADVCSGVLLWTACTYLPARPVTAISPGKSDSWRQAGSVKNCQKVMNGNRMWSCDTELCTNGVVASKGWVFIAHFSIYSTSRCHCHAGSDTSETPWSNSSKSHVVRTVRHWISSPHQPCENPCHPNVFALPLLWMARAKIS